MAQNGNGGTIVNISSQASKIGIRDHSAYCASKGALDALTKVMALELGPSKVSYLYWMSRLSDAVFFLYSTFSMGFNTDVWFDWCI